MSNPCGINDLVSCPFDPVHRMRRSRLQIHIAKCRMNNLDKQVDICPFNATHIVAKGTLAEHISRCDSRLPLDRELSANLDKNNIYKGRTAVPSYHHETPQMPPLEETWDVDPVPSLGYVPPANIPDDALLPDLGMMKPAERKKIYRSRVDEADDNEAAASSVTQSLVGPPQPVSKEHLYKMQNPPNVGLGRGLPKPATSNSEVVIQEPKQPKSYRDVLSQFPHLRVGLGRGNSMQASQGVKPPVPIGRGAPSAP